MGPPKEPEPETVPAHTTLENGVYYYQRRVPLHVRDLEKKTFVRKSLRTGDRTLAARKASDIDRELEAKWDALLSGRKAEAERRHEAVVKISHTFGFAYRQAEEAAASVSSEEPSAWRKSPSWTTTACSAGWALSTM